MTPPPPPAEDTLPKSGYVNIVRPRPGAGRGAAAGTGQTAGMPKFTTLKGTAAPLDLQVRPHTTRARAGARVPPHAHLPI